MAFNADTLHLGIIVAVVGLGEVVAGGAFFTYVFTVFM